MNSDRKAAVTAGILFIVGTAAPMVGMGITGSLASIPDYLMGISANANKIVLGAFLQIVMGFACAGIAMAMFPVLKKFSEGVAIGTVGFRLIEGILASIAAIMVLVLVSLGFEFLKAGAPDTSYFQTIAGLLLSLKEKLSMISLFAWCVSALMYYTVFYQTRLVPRWISFWGLAGISLSMVANFLVLFGLIKNFSTLQVVMNLPIAVQEMVFAVWLIAKGFDQKVLDSHTLEAQLEG